MLSIQMKKLCGYSICKPLLIIFNDCLNEEKFPSEWKKASTVPVYKKEHKQCLKHYGPISSVLICRKISKRLISQTSIFFKENNLIFLNQSGFSPVNSYVNQ